MLFTWVCKGEDGQQHSAKTGTTSDVCKQDTVGPSSGLKDGVASESGLGLHTLIAKQQNEFAGIWSSPEKQAEECSKAYDAFPIMLSFLQAVLS
ncbi:hypothetical protein ABBQ32_004287 [Trebouxia sp. C0010 RCD-2024]